jgi:hypothetical protein
MQDRAMQALYLQALDPIAETLADPNSYGFRKERGCADAMAQCATVLSNGTRPQWILELTFRTLYRTFEAILEEPPAETGGGAIYRLFHTSQPIVATSFSP